MKNDNVKKTRYFVNTQHDFDAILEYAKQEGFITTRLEDDIKETFNIKNTNNVDAIVETAVKEGYFEFYEYRGISYRLTLKGLKRFPH